MKNTLGIIGHPLSHSISPAMHQGALDHLGLDIVYEYWELLSEEIPSFFQNMRSKGSGILGCSVTLPYKELASRFLDEITEEGQRAGAINTVVNQDGLLIGHNTDGLGFLSALNSDSEISLFDKNILVLGAGGAARGVSMATTMYNPKKITIANRNPNRGANLAADLKREWGGQVEFITLDDDRLSTIAGNSDVIVQTTTVGMRHGPDETGKSIPVLCISPSTIVYDLVYNPSITPFMRMATDQNAQVYGGLSMLVHQGAIAFELWTGVVAPTQIMFEAARKSLAKKLNES